VDVPDEKAAEEYEEGDRCPKCERLRPESETTLRRASITDLATGKELEALICQLCLTSWRPEEQPEWRLNLRKAKRRLHLLSELSVGEFGPKIKLHDPVQALTLLGKKLGLFTEKHDVTVHDDGTADALDRKLDSLAARLAAAGVPGEPVPDGEASALTPVELLGAG
jgi:hypothetical protein